MLLGLRLERVINNIVDYKAIIGILLSVITSFKDIIVVWKYGRSIRLYGDVFVLNQA